MGVDQIISLYQAMNPGLHKDAGSSTIDIPAFIYASLRLPECIYAVKRVILSQTYDIFERDGYDVNEWIEVTAPARRRKMYFNGQDTLAIIINSVTDVDDVVGLLTAFQVEWNKMQRKLRRHPSEDPKELRKMLDISAENWDKLEIIFGDHLLLRFQTIAEHDCALKIRLLRGSYIDYEKGVSKWFENIIKTTQYEDFTSRPLYMVSSNTHSIVNNITGWVTMYSQELLQYLRDKNMKQYLDYWEKINQGSFPGSRENFLWYILKKYEKEYPHVKEKRIHYGLS